MLEIGKTVTLEVLRAVPMGLILGSVEDEILLKISAENLLDARFREQVLRGLGASGLRLGLLLDFGGDELRFCRIL